MSSPAPAPAEPGGDKCQQQLDDKEPPRSKYVGHYVLGKTIGEGTFGKVKLGTHVLTGQRVAVKVLEKDRIVEIADVERVAREVHILKLIRHPHIVQLYEIIETKRQLYLIMEYAAGGELFDYIVARDRVQEPEACRLFHQIISGIEKIHSMNIVHRDLKPENLLLDHNHAVKIVDFGLSNVFREGQLLRTACGSPCYAPPEMISGNPYLPRGCDLWSAGVILFAVVCGYLPFEDPSTAELYRTILTGDFECPDFLSEPVKDLIGGLLTVDPARRLGVQEVRRHPWCRQIPEAALPAQWLPGAREPEEDLLKELESFGFPREHAVRCLELNKHNHVTTTYYLLAERRRKALCGKGGNARAPVANSLGGTDPFSLIGAEAEQCGGPALGVSDSKAGASELAPTQATASSARPLSTTPPPSGTPRPGRAASPVHAVGRVAAAAAASAPRSPPRSPVQHAQAHLASPRYAASPRLWSPGGGLRPADAPRSPGGVAYAADAARRAAAGQQPAPWPCAALRPPAAAAASGGFSPGAFALRGCGPAAAKVSSPPPRALSPAAGRRDGGSCDGRHSAAVAELPGASRRSATPRPASPAPAVGAARQDCSPRAARHVAPAPALSGLAAYHHGRAAPAAMPAERCGGAPGRAGSASGLQQQPPPPPQQAPSLVASLLAASPRYAAGGYHSSRRSSRPEPAARQVPHTPRADLAMAHQARPAGTMSLPAASGGRLAAGPPAGGVASATSSHAFSVSPRGSAARAAPGVAPASARACSQGPSHAGPPAGPPRGGPRAPSPAPALAAWGPRLSGAGRASQPPPGRSAF